MAVWMGLLVAFTPSVAGAHSGLNSGSFDGPNCDWYGQNEYLSSLQQAQAITDSTCLDVQVRMRYWHTNGNCITTTLLQQSDGDVVQTINNVAQHLDWSDHNTRPAGGAWGGFRVQHTGGCF